MSEYYVNVATGDDGDNGSTEELAWQTLSHANATIAAGDTVHVKAAGSYVVQDGANGCVLYCTTTGTVTQPITYAGYTTTPGDGGIVTIDAGTNSLANCVAGNLTSWCHCFKNFRFTGASGSGVSVNGTAGDYIKFFNCQFDTNGAYGCQGDDGLMFIQCTFNNNTSGGVDCDNYALALACKFHTNSGIGMICDSAAMVAFCVFYNNGANANLRITSFTPALIIGNSFDGDNAASSIGILQNDADGFGMVVVNNILYDLATGISRGGTVGENQFVDYNLFYSCTADYSNIPAGAHDVTGTSDPFTDSGARDYTLKSGSEALAEGIDAGVL